MNSQEFNKYYLLMMSWSIPWPTHKIPHNHPRQRKIDHAFTDLQGGRVRTFLHNSFQCLIGLVSAGRFFPRRKHLRMLYSKCWTLPKALNPVTVVTRTYP